MSSNDDSAQSRREDWEKLQSQWWSAWSDINRKASDALGAEVAPWHEGLEIWEKIMRTGASGSSSSAPSNLVMDKLIEQGKAYLAMAQSLTHSAGADQPQFNPSELGKQWSDSLRELLGKGMGGPQEWFSKLFAGASPDQSFFRLQRMFGQFNPMAEGMMPTMAMPDLSGGASGALSDLLGTPAFGHNREKQEAQQALMRHLLDYQKANKGYNDLMLRCVQQGLERFEDKLIERSEPGRRLDSMRAVYDLWIDALQESYAEIALSADFRNAYGELVNAQMRLRNSVQKQIEEATGQLGMPTRSEIDSVHKRVHALSRARFEQSDVAEELSALKAELAELRSTVAQLKKSEASSAAREPAPAKPASASAVSTPAKRAKAKPESGTTAAAKVEPKVVAGKAAAKAKASAAKSRTAASSASKTTPARKRATSKRTTSES